MGPGQAVGGRRDVTVLRDAIERSLPGVAAAAEDGVDSDEGLTGEEAAAIRRAVPSRRAEFAAGRRCARQALSRLGLEPTSIPRGSNGEPRWPAGIVGSVSHTDTLAIAAAAWSTDVRSVGLDVEPNLPLPDRVRRRIARPDEWGLIYPALTDRSLFSAKEAAYKAAFGCDGIVRWFTDIRLQRGSGRTLLAHVERFDEPIPVICELVGDDILAVAEVRK